MSLSFKRLTAIIFALYPILWIYQSPFSIVYGDLFLFLLAVYGIVRYRYIKIDIPQFYLLWGCVALTTVFNMYGYWSVTTFIPGGVTFFVFAITYLFLCEGFDYEVYKKHYKRIAIVSIALWAIQDIMYFTIGTRISGLIPFLNIAGDVTTQQLIAAQMVMDRSSSFFREPAHFIQFLLPILCIDLFEEKNRKKMFSRFSLIVVACMLLSRSGNAVVGLLPVLTAKAIYLLRSKGNRFAYFLILIPIATIALYFYISSNLGVEMMGRFEEFDDERSSGYFRVVRGFTVFSELPKLNQFIGIYSQELELLLPRMSLLFLSGQTNTDLYFNGFQNILIHHGYIGMFFFVIFFISIYRKTTFLGKSMIWLTLVLSLIANIYLTYCMMICMVVSTIEIKNVENDKNSLLHKRRLS